MKLQKLVTSFLLFSLVVGLVGCSKETVVEEEPATAVAVLPASRGQLVCWERVSGKAGAQEEVYIVPQLGGEITAVEVKTGDRVEKGQVLVRLDNTDLMLQVEQAEAGLQVAQAQLDRALAGASEEDLARLEAAVAQAEAGVEAAIVNLYSVLGGFSPVHQQLAGAEAQYRQAQIARKQAENQLYQVMFGSAVEQADLAVDQAREARKIVKDRLESLKDSKRDLEREINQIQAWESEKEILEGKDERTPEEEARLTELKERLSKAPDVTELYEKVAELETLIEGIEPEYKMAKYQEEQAKVARDRVLIETREQAELALEQAEEAEKAARRQVEMLRKTAAQQEQLALGQKTQAEAGLEAARAGLEQARKGAREEDLRAAEAGVKQARAALALARRQLKRGTIEAPISGVVTALDAQVGALAGPGTPLMAIVNPNLIKVEFNLTERLIDKVAPGDEVVVRFLSLPGQEFSGVVTAVSPAADPRTGVFLVEATLENEAGLLAPGFFAEVDLVVDASEGNLVIPRSALLREGDQYYVYIVEGERARKKLVTLGLSDGEKVEVLSGLEEDDLVVIKGQHYLEEGSKVSISEGLGGDGE
jgi:RND family efflux transporter MFP subunit